MRTKLFLLLLFAAGFPGACSEGGDAGGDVVPMLFLEPASVSTGAAPALERVTMISDGPLDFSALILESDEPGWCRVSRGDSPDAMEVSVDENDFGRVRRATVTVKSPEGSVLRTLAVRQGTSAVALEPAELAAGYEAAVECVRIISADSSFLAGLVFDSDSPEWCRVARGSSADILEVTFDKNTGQSARRASVTVRGPEGRVWCTLPVRQGTLDYALSESELYADRLPAVFSVDVFADGPTDAVSSAPEWCGCRTEGRTVVVELAGNSGGRVRTAEVTVSVDGVPRTMTVTQGRYATGDVYSEENTSGIVVSLSDDKLHGMVISADEGEASWSTVYRTTGATDRDDGRSNMNVIRAVSGWRELYPAFAWCDALNREGTVSGWYLPATNELLAVNDRYAEIDSALRAAGMTPLTDLMYYWSSTDIENNYASNVRLSDRYVDMYNDKAERYKVRAARAF